MKPKDRREFIDYLRVLTNDQVRNVYAKEKAANRRGYASLARAEAERRGLGVLS